MRRKEARIAEERCNQSNPRMLYIIWDEKPAAAEDGDGWCVKMRDKPRVQGQRYISSSTDELLPVLPHSLSFRNDSRAAGFDQQRLKNEYCMERSNKQRKSIHSVFRIQGPLHKQRPTLYWVTRKTKY